MNPIRSLFMSREQRQAQARMALRRTVRGMERYEASCASKKDEIAHLACTARDSGLADDYCALVSFLDMIIRQQKQAQAMILRISMMDAMQEMNSMSASFMKVSGRIGATMSRTVANMNFTRNQTAFEQGVQAMELARDQLRDFLPDIDQTISQLTGSDDAIRAEIDELLAGNTTLESLTSKADELERELG